MEFKDLSLLQIAEGIKSGKFTSVMVCKYFMDRCEKYKDYNAVIEVYDDVLEKAKAIDEKIAQGQKVGKLAGVPIAIKDNLLYKGKKMSVASKLMKDFVCPYSATVVRKLEEEDAVIFGRTNMDEFAMGGSCENTIYGACKNAIDPECVSGGSSGGSAVAVAKGLCVAAIGTDTGGSVRQPASFNGIVGVKPTFGRVSRYGLVAFASSTDQAAPMTKTVADSKYLLDIIAGKDKNDATSIEMYKSVEEKDKIVLGMCKGMKEKIEGLKTYPQFKELLEKVKAEGVEIVEVDVPHILNTLACYYIITGAEAASNLARFDGVKYTARSESAKTLEEVYVQSRTEGFGKEVKRRIMLGNFVLSSGYYDAYYKKAKRLQVLLKREFAAAFEKCDGIILPTTAGVAFKIGEKTKDPISMYIEDLFTVPASIAGIPAISVPFGTGDRGLPLGVQVLCGEGQEDVLYKIASKIEEVCKGGR